MVSLYFGLPGCGKTTLCCKMAIDAVKGKKYKNVYCNVNMNVPGVIHIEKDDLGTYQLENGIILFDEATLSFDSRNYKDFAEKFLQFFLLHRHYNIDIVLFSQGWDSTDKRIRQITDRVYYVYKGIFTRSFISKYYRIPYGIIIPDPKDGGEKLGEIVQGYCKPTFLQRLFSHKVHRRKYYKYFDSWEAPKLIPLPADRMIESKVVKVDYLQVMTDKVDNMIMKFKKRKSKEEEFEVDFE